MDAPHRARIEKVPSRCHTPDEDLTFERDAARLIGWDEVVVHVTRIRFDNPTTPENLRAMGPRLAVATELLVPGAALAAVAFAQVRPNVPVVTPSSAGLVALTALNAHRVALLTPYLPQTTAPMVAFFEAKGLSVVRSACFGLEDDREMARLDRDAIVEAAIALDSEDVEALFLSCTAMPSLDVIGDIEVRLDKPVVCSNQATLWALRKFARLPQQPPRSGGAGRLFDLPEKEAA